MRRKATQYLLFLRMKKVSLILLVIVLSSFTGDQFTLIKKIPVKALFITSDKLGNCYVVTENNQVTKYNSQGIEEANFSNKNLGKLKWVDATNPLKVLLFYSDFNQITIVDNKLSVRTQVALRELNILQPLLVCTSVNDGLWIYDQQDFQLKRLDMDLKLIQESGNIIQITGLEIKPTQLVEENNYLYLNNPATGILIFDLFGTYYKTIPIKGISSIQVVGDDLFYYKDTGLTRYNLNTLQEINIPLPEIADSLILTVRIEPPKIYLLKQQELNIYSIL